MIRQIATTDADAFLDLCLALDRETTYMMYEPGERQSSPANERDRIAAILGSRNQMILVADNGHRLDGYIGIYGGEYLRVAHVAYVIAGVRQDATGRGLGRLLFEDGIAWARAAGIRRLELTVMTHNERAVRLYERMGFEVEGTRRRAMRVDGAWVDEYYMGRLLD